MRKIKQIVCAMLVGIGSASVAYAQVETLTPDTVLSLYDNGGALGILYRVEEIEVNGSFVPVATVEKLLTEDSPLAVGDEIIRIDGKAAQDPSQFVTYVHSLPPGATAEITVLPRGDNELAVKTVPVVARDLVRVEGVSRPPSTGQVMVQGCVEGAVAGGLVGFLALLLAPFDAGITFGAVMSTVGTGAAVGCVTTAPAAAAAEALYDDDADLVYRRVM
jgi:hypothetical protein